MLITIFFPIHYFKLILKMFCPGQDVIRYPWCATRQPKDFFVYQVLGLNILSAFICSSINKNYLNLL